MTVDELVNKLAKPMMVYRYARADTRTNSGAEKRAENASAEIRKIVGQYVREAGYIEVEGEGTFLVEDR